MADLIVNGGKPLSGTIIPSGNKNSALPILCATLLAGEPMRLLNVPAITDLEKLVEFFTVQGSRITWDKAKGEMRVDHSTFDAARLRGEMPAGMRSTVLLFAPLLGRMKKIVVPTGAEGCSLGIRELDPHFEILKALGAVITQDGTLTLTLDGRYRGTRHWQDYMSVTATENFVMAAVLAEGVSTLINAASEPHVQDLCAMLNAMGAKIEGAGTSTINPSQNVDSRVMGAGAQTYTQSTEIVVQLDCHSANVLDSADHAQMISTLFRDEYATSFFAALPAPLNAVTPLYADDPKMIPFINAENQWETRWVVEAFIQANQVISAPQPAADAIELGVVSVEEAFPV